MLRLTGMPLLAARFQSISALTGTGFTTQEAEITMHHPLRRKVLIGLMFAGHLGVVSLASTVILAISTSQDGTVFWTVIYMLLALIIICALAMSEAVDKILCKAVARVIIQFGWIKGERYLVAGELPDGTILAEHVVSQQCTIDADALGLSILRVNEAKPVNTVSDLTIGDRVVCFGARDAQTALSAITMQSSEVYNDIS